jgi:hypothetical protein
MTRQDVQSSRSLLRSNPNQFDSILQNLHISPRANMLHYCTFMTPTFEKRQYETHFFLAEVGEEECQTMEADGEETESLLWLNPVEAMEMQRDGNISFLPPQYYIFDDFAKDGDIDALVSRLTPVVGKQREDKRLDARGFPPMRPCLVHDASTAASMTLALPYDEAHEEWPGRPGQMHRVLCGLPMGRGEYTLQKAGMEE